MSSTLHINTPISNKHPRDLPMQIECPKNDTRCKLNAQYKSDASKMMPYTNFMPQYKLKPQSKLDTLETIPITN